MQGKRLSAGNDRYAALPALIFLSIAAFISFKARVELCWFYLGFAAFYNEVVHTYQHLISTKRSKLEQQGKRGSVSSVFKNTLGGRPHKAAAGNGLALIALGLVCFFWGTTWIASKQGVKGMPALQMAGIRQTLGGLCYVLFFLVRGARWPQGREWRTIGVLSFLNFAMSNGLSTWGVKFISAGLGAIIGAIFPLWLVIIGLIVNKKAPSSKALSGLSIGFTGICVIFYEHLEDFFDPQFLFGIFLSVVATWTWAFGTLYTKKHAQGFNPYFSLGLQMVLSGIFLYVVSAITGQAIPFTAIPWQSWAAISYLVSFGSVISFIAYLYALQRLPTEQVSLYAYINPIVAVVFGALLFGEPLTLFIIVGTLITLYGVYLVNKSVVKVVDEPAIKKG